MNAPHSAKEKNVLVNKSHQDTKATDACNRSSMNQSNLSHTQSPAATGNHYRTKCQFAVSSCRVQIFQEIIPGNH